MLALAIRRAQKSRDKQRIIGKIDDLFNVRAEALFGFRHVAVCFEARRRVLLAALLPCAVARFIFSDLFGLLRVEAIERMDHASTEIELRIHRMQFGA